MSPAAIDVYLVTAPAEPWQPTPTSVPVLSSDMYAGSAALEGVTVAGGIASTLASAPSNLPLCEQFSTFQSYLESLPFAVQQLLQELDIRIPVPELIQLLNSTHPQLSAPLQCIGVSDGSENQGSMTFGWLIADPNPIATNGSAKVNIW
eukprot:scaffold9811_cov93-Cylindrotheca_fusiformis.AAC.2